MKRKAKNNSYWRWHKRFAFLPIRIDGNWVWLETYWWRVPFDINLPIRMIYRTTSQPEYDYTDEIAAEEGARQLMREITRSLKI